MCGFVPQVDFLAVEYRKWSLHTARSGKNEIGFNNVK